MVCRNFILPEFCKPCLLLSSFQFAKLIVPYQELQAEIEDGKKKIRQLENREKVLRQKLSQEERRTRSHRLIVRGAVFESIVPEAKTMTDEEAAAFLRLALTSEEARAYLKKRTEGGKSE